MGAVEAIIRPMRLDDAEAVASLCGELGYPTNAADVGERFALLSARPDCLLVAEDDRQVLGWIHVQPALVLEAEPWAEVAGLVVTESARGLGVGHALLDAGERWASEHGFETVRLRSNVVRTAAHGFYRHRGYEVFKKQLNFRKPLRRANL